MKKRCIEFIRKIDEKMIFECAIVIYIINIVIDLYKDELSYMGILATMIYLTLYFLLYVAIILVPVQSPQLVQPLSLYT